MRNTTIAVIDDDEGVRTSLASLVRSLGFSARSYASADEFLADAGRGDPACVISDIQMPGITGDQLQAILIAAGRRIPIILITAFHVEATRDRVMQAGAVAYLIKPADADTIALYLATALRGGSPSDFHPLV